MASKSVYFAILAVSLTLCSTWVQPVNGQMSRAAACKTLCGGFSDASVFQPRTPDCGNGYVWSVGLHMCVSVNLKGCEPGYEWSYWQGKCVKTGRGFSDDRGVRPRKSDCGNGYVWNAGLHKCVPLDLKDCEPGYEWSFWELRCVETDGGVSDESGVQPRTSDCGNGFVWSVGLHKCVSVSLKGCEPGYEWSYWKGMCVQSG